MFNDQVAVRAESYLEPVSRSCACSVSQSADEVAECFMRARIRVSQALETGYHDSVVLRHHEHSTEVKLHHVGEKTDRHELPSREIRDRGSGLRHESKPRGIRRLRATRFRGVFARALLQRVSQLCRTFANPAASPVILLPDPARDYTERKTCGPA